MAVGNHGVSAREVGRNSFEFANVGDRPQLVLDAVRQKKTTNDIGGTLGTREAGEWVAEKVARR